jgi:hypothetical protein
MRPEPVEGPKPARCALSLWKGGQGRNRTGDLSLFRRTLLPTELPGLLIGDGFTTAFATPTGLEPATSAVTGRRANQLRHGALWAQGTHPSGRPRNYSAAPRCGGKSDVNASLGSGNAGEACSRYGCWCYTSPHRLVA